MPLNTPAFRTAIDNRFDENSELLNVAVLERINRDARIIDVC
jgi:hypothetical protein